MAFQIHSVDDGRVLGIEYLPCSAIVPKVGMAMTMSGGNLAVASGTVKPTYISMTEKYEACTAGDIIPVLRVAPDVIYQTRWSADGSAVNIGDKVTISADGLEATATTTSGVMEVVGRDGNSIGDAVRVRFA